MGLAFYHAVPGTADKAGAGVRIYPVAVEVGHVVDAHVASRSLLLVGCRAGTRGRAGRGNRDDPDGTPTCARRSADARCSGTRLRQGQRSWSALSISPRWVAKRSSSGVSRNLMIAQALDQIRIGSHDVMSSSRGLMAVSTGRWYGRLSQRKFRFALHLADERSQLRLVAVHVELAGGRRMIAPSFMFRRTSGTPARGVAAARRSAQTPADLRTAARARSRVPRTGRSHLCRRPPG